jgi:hypothetical protein
MSDSFGRESSSALGIKRQIFTPSRIDRASPVEQERAGDAAGIPGDQPECRHLPGNLADLATGSPGSTSSATQYELANCLCIAHQEYSAAHQSGATAVIAP